MWFDKTLILELDSLLMILDKEQWFPRKLTFCLLIISSITSKFQWTRPQIRYEDAGKHATGGREVRIIPQFKSQLSLECVKPQLACEGQSGSWEPCSLREGLAGRESYSTGTLTNIAWRGTNIAFSKFLSL